MVNLPEPDYRGKVRDLFFIDRERMLVRASDRLSAFDVVFGQPIPDKGRILTRVSNLWFEALRKSGLQQEFEFEDHLLETADDRLPEPFCNHPDFVGRSVLVRRTERVDFECVVRGYLAGSGWKVVLKRNGSSRRRSTSRASSSVAGTEWGTGPMSELKRSKR